MTAAEREARFVRTATVSVAIENASRHYKLAECCADMIAHWQTRAEHHRQLAIQWAEQAETGARMLAKDVAESEDKAAHSRAPAVHVASWDVDDAANDAERRSA